MKSVLIICLGLLVVVGAAAAWIGMPHRVQASPRTYVEVRLAQVEEVAPGLRAADPTGAVWARHYSENLPAKAARACGAARFDVLSASDFSQSVRIPSSDADRPFLQCVRRQGGGYLQFAKLEGEEG